MRSLLDIRDVPNIKFIQESNSPVWVVVSEFAGYLNVPRLGRRGLDSFAAGTCREDDIEAFVDSNIVILRILFAECKCVEVSQCRQRL